MTQLTRFDRRHRWTEWADDPEPLWIRRTCRVCGVIYRQRGTLPTLRAMQHMMSIRLSRHTAVSALLMDPKTTISGGGKIAWGFE